MPGMLSSGAKQRLPNYEVCNNYHCPDTRLTTGQTDTQQISYVEELLLCLSLSAAVPTLLEGLNDAVCCPTAHQPPAAELLRNAPGVTKFPRRLHHRCLGGSGHHEGERQGWRRNGQGERRHPGKGGLQLSEKGSPELDRVRAALKSSSEQS